MPRVTLFGDGDHMFLGFVGVLRNRLAICAAEVGFELYDDSYQGMALAMPLALSRKRKAQRLPLCFSVSPVVVCNSQIAPAPEGAVFSTR
jgi:hypothetical protein